MAGSSSGSSPAYQEEGIKTSVTKQRVLDDLCENTSISASRRSVLVSRTGDWGYQFMRTRCACVWKGSRTSPKREEGREGRGGRWDGVVVVVITALLESPMDKWKMKWKAGFIQGIMVVDGISRDVNFSLQKLLTNSSDASHACGTCGRPKQ